MARSGTPANDRSEPTGLKNTNRWHHGKHGCLKNASSTCWAACAFVCSGVEKLPCETPAALRCARRRLIPREHQQARDMCWSTRQHMGRLEGRGSQDLAGSPFPRVRTKSIAWTHTRARARTHARTEINHTTQFASTNLPVLGADFAGSAVVFRGVPPQLARRAALNLRAWRFGRGHRVGDK